MNIQKAVLYSDGGSRGNPGPSAIGYSIQDENGIEIFACGRPTGIGTNNEAEYKALLEGLQKVKELQIPEVEALLDSELVVKQILGAYKVKSENLLDLYAQVQKARKGFQEFSIRHIPRSKNKRADQLVNKALDDGVAWTYERGEENKPLPPWETSSGDGEGQEISTKSVSIISESTKKTLGGEKEASSAGRLQGERDRRKKLFRIQTKLEEKGYQSVILHEFHGCVLFEGNIEEQRRLYKEQNFWIDVLEAEGFSMGGLAFRRSIRS